MAKDYAKKNRDKRSSSSNDQSSGKLWLVALVLIGCFVLGLVYLKQQNERLELASQQTAEVPPAQKTHAVKSPPAATAPPAKTTPRFDFYNMLPKVAVPAPSDNGQQPTTLPAPINNQPAPAPAVVPPVTAPVNAAPARGYIIQVGLFKDYAAADELKAEVTLQGFEAHINTLTKNGVTSYRVWLGPFTTRTDAQQTQQNLEANQLKGVLIKE